MPGTHSRTEAHPPLDLLDIERKARAAQSAAFAAFVKGVGKRMRRSLADLHWPGHRVA